MGKWSIPHPAKKSVACVCAQCGKDFEVPAWKAAQGKGRYCSTQCYRLGSRSKDGVEYDGLWFSRTGKNNYYWHKRSDKTVVSLHRYTWEKHNGPIPDGYHVHHLDHDSANNAIENLELISVSDHGRMHIQHRIENGTLDIESSLAKAREAAKEWHRQRREQKALTC